MGVSHRDLACHASRLTPHARNHLARAAQEIEFLYSGLPADILSDQIQRIYWENGREAYVSRLAAVLHHLGSALTAVGCTDAELSAAPCAAAVKQTGDDDATAVRILPQLYTAEIADVINATNTPDEPPEALTNVHSEKK